MNKIYYFTCEQSVYFPNRRVLCKVEICKSPASPCLSAFGNVVDKNVTGIQNKIIF